MNLIEEKIIMEGWYGRDGVIIKWGRDWFYKKEG